MHSGGPLPIGSLHVRDFADLRQQVPLSQVPVDARGFVRFCCMACPRTGKIAAANLRARFRPQEGLVNILNEVAPKDCPHTKRDAFGSRHCGWRYRDLGERP